MNKIIELLIDWDNLEFEDLGVDIMSLVDKPAIGISWQKFAAQQFVEPQAGESKEEYVSRCIPVLTKEGYEQDQAAAICYNSFDEKFLEDNPCQSGYVAYGTKIKDGREVPNCIPIQNAEFESYTDYPEAAKNNAKRAIEWAEKNGWGDCGTDVGKQRAHQLAKGEPISADTIARMASFARHKQNSDTPYSEGCGKLMWDAWGGTAGIEWAQRKLASIQEMGVDTGNLQPYVDQDEELKKKIIEIAQSDEFGEWFDFEKVVVIKEGQTEFSTIGDYMKGVIGLDILGKRDLPNVNQEAETKYRYSGPPAERNFCRAMQRMNKLYTREEIDEMSNRINTGFRHNNQPYSLFDFKGGVNCKHYWTKLRVFKGTNGSAVMIDQGPASGRAGQIADSGNNFWRFAADDEQMIISGPAMIPFQMIPRKDALGNLFHVYFTDETIKKIALKFLEENKQHNTDVNHDNIVVEENTLIESWLVDDPKMDKATAMGFDVPKGTWMVSYKINNQETWQKIKNGELNGFSITGNFIERAQ